jgi:transposase
VTKIARRLGSTRPTVYRYLAMDTPPARRRLHIPGPRVLDPYRTYVVERWNEGCRNAQDLTRELTAMGYTHSTRTVSRFLAACRREPPL